jgi:Domain of unknown function (DUF222)
MSSNRSEVEHPSGSSLPELARAITTGAVRLAAATAAWLRLVAEFDERGGWHGVGINSCAHWLAWQCGMAPVTAREHVRVARALRGLPKIAAAFGNGRLSYAKVRAMTRIAVPDCEAALLDFATSATASQTERFCRAARRRRRRDSGGRTAAGGRAVLPILDRRRGFPDAEDPDARRGRRRPAHPHRLPRRARRPP